MKTNLFFLLVLVLSCLNTVKPLTRNLGKSEKYETSLGLYVQKVYHEIAALNNIIENNNLEVNEYSSHPGFNDYSNFIIHGF